MIKPSAPPDAAESQCAAWALLVCMSAYSELYFKGPWAPHIQDLFWQDACLVSQEEKPKILKPHEAATLAWLSLQAQGWWSWTSRDNAGPTFVTLEDWG